MGWLAIVSAAISLVLEIIKLIRDDKAEKKEASIELKKQKTEAVQSIARGLIDRDGSRVNAGFERLRLLKG